MWHWISSERRFLLTVGPLCIIFAAVLEWYASPATLSLTRTGPDAVSVSMVSKLFGRLTTTTTRYDGVQSAAIVIRPSARRSIDSERLVFYMPPRPSIAPVPSNCSAPIFQRSRAS